MVTIDDATTTEVDDGLSVEFLEGGRVRLWVHVADPTRWIRPEVALDLEARRRGSTMYLPTGALPALSPFALCIFMWCASDFVLSPCYFTCSGGNVPLLLRCSCCTVRILCACASMASRGHFRQGDHSTIMICNQSQWKQD